MGVSTGITWDGYTIAHCECLQCGHKATIAAARLWIKRRDGSIGQNKKARFHCGRCGGDRVRVLFGHHKGRPPDNVTPIKS